MCHNNFGNYSNHNSFFYKKKKLKISQTIRVYKYSQTYFESSTHLMKKCHKLDI